MAISYSDAVANNRLNQVSAAVDGGAAAGTLEIGSAGFAAVLAIFTFSDPSAAAAAARVLTFSGMPKATTGLVAGTAAAARLKDSNGVIVASSLTVGTAGTDVILDNTSIAVGQNLNLVAATITHAA